MNSPLQGTPCSPGFSPGRFDHAGVRHSGPSSLGSLTRVASARSRRGEAAVSIARKSSGPCQRPARPAGRPRPVPAGGAGRRRAGDHRQAQVLGIAHRKGLPERGEMQQRGLAADPVRPLAHATPFRSRWQGSGSGAAGRHRGTSAARPGFRRGRGRGLRKVGEPGRGQAPAGQVQAALAGLLAQHQHPCAGRQVPVRLLLGGKPGSAAKAGDQRNRAKRPDMGRGARAGSAQQGAG